MLVDAVQRHDRFRFGLGFRYDRVLTVANPDDSIFPFLGRATTVSLDSLAEQPTAWRAQDSHGLCLSRGPSATSHRPSCGEQQRTISPCIHHLLRKASSVCPFQPSLDTLCSLCVRAITRLADRPAPCLPPSRPCCLDKDVKLERTAMRISPLRSPVCLPNQPSLVLTCTITLSPFPHHEHWRSLRPPACSTGLPRPDDEVPNKVSATAVLDLTGTCATAHHCSLTAPLLHRHLVKWWL
jgi:hypothetical protein